CSSDLVAGITLGVIRVRADPPELRYAFDADGDVATPLVLDAGVRELRKHPEHVGPERGGDVPRSPSRVVAQAAEQQPAIRRQPRSEERRVGKEGERRGRPSRARKSDEDV